MDGTDMTTVNEIIRAHNKGDFTIITMSERSQINRLINEIERLTEESARDQRNAANSQAEASKLLDSNNNFIMRHLGCMTLLNNCRRHLSDNSELKDQIDHALADGATLHPRMEIHQMKSGDWWIEPKGR
jgi:hypothetical protein